MLKEEFCVWKWGFCHRYTQFMAIFVKMMVNQWMQWDTQISEPSLSVVGSVAFGELKFHQHLAGTRASTFLSCRLSSSWASLFSFGSCFLPTTMPAAFSDPAVCIFWEKRHTCTQGFAKSKAKESCTCSYGSTRVANCIDGPQCKVTGGYQTDIHSALYMAAQLQKVKRDSETPAETLAALAEETTTFCMSACLPVNIATLVFMFIYAIPRPPGYINATKHSHFVTLVRQW